MRVSKWGNSLAVRIPADVITELNLQEGDEVNIRPSKQNEFLLERKPTREELIARIRKLSSPLPKGFRFNREEANAR